MAKVLNYECDFCRTLLKKSFLVNIEIKTQILNDSDTKPTESSPAQFKAEVCSKECGVRFMEKSFENMSDAIKKSDKKGGEL